MLASYMRPPLATVKVAMPLWNLPTVFASFLPPLAPMEDPPVEPLAPAAAVIATAEASAPNSNSPLVNSLKARSSSKTTIWL